MNIFTKYFAIGGLLSANLTLAAIASEQPNEDQPQPRPSVTEASKDLGKAVEAKLDKEVPKAIATFDKAEKDTRHAVKDTEKKVRHKIKGWKKESKDKK